MVCECGWIVNVDRPLLMTSGWPLTSSDYLRPQQPEKELKIKLITKETERAEDARAFAAHLQRKDRKQEDRVGRKAGSTIVKLNELLLSIARGVCASVNRQAEHYAPFERPAVEEAGPFYLRVIEHPMDIHTIIQKAKGGAVPGTSASEQGHGYADGTRLTRPACKCSPRRPTPLPPQVSSLRGVPSGCEAHPCQLRQVQPGEP